VHSTNQEGFVVKHAGAGTLAIGSGSDYEVAVSTNDNVTDVTVSSSGGGLAHANMPPSQAVNFIIKT
jgi:microcystin-dependent protein